MKNFRFKNIWMLSYRDKRARWLDFHPKKNLILGRNHTGKSSLIRMIFETLGAVPQGKLEQWDANTITMLDFSIDEESFFALHDRGYRALFNAGGKLLTATGEHSRWAGEFALVTGFNLVLSDKKADVMNADPSCFFLPFYINQMAVGSQNGTLLEA